jgi:hypothetical protein
VKRHLTKYLLLLSTTGLFARKNNKVQIVFNNNQRDTATGETVLKIYKLKEKALTSDFQYSKLDNIDDNIEDTLNAKPVFEPVGGKFTYYKFIATFKGWSFQEIEKDFHDILIIKTDNSNKIVDAFQYTLEWAEAPLQYDLCKMTAKNLQLTDNMDISLLKLMRTSYLNEEERFLKENGVIKLQ